jgi:hypothetical protein
MRALELKITRDLGSGGASTQHAAPAPVVELPAVADGAVGVDVVGADAVVGVGSAVARAALGRAA